MTNVIKIQTQETAIPVEFGKLNFKFDTSDDSIQEFYKAHAKLEKEMKGVEIVEGEELDGVKGILKEIYDTTLGAGAFEKIYKQTPSSLQLTGHLFNLMEGISEQIEALGLSESQRTKVDKYLVDKKK